jgi:uncharacterized protein YukE
MRIKITPEMQSKAQQMLEHFDSIEQHMQQAQQLITSLQTNDEWAGPAQQAGLQSFTQVAQQMHQVVEAHRQVAQRIILAYQQHTRVDQDIAKSI